jgi:catechol 2,3-dioxygenase-like lactoylglutathione lyase family enzyme
MHTDEPPHLSNFIMIPAMILAALISGGHLLAQTAAPTGDANPLQLSPHHATASVADIEKEAKWYEQVLGFQEAQRFKNGTDSELRQMVIPGYRIDLLWQRGSSRPDSGSGSLKQGWFHVVFRTPIVDADFKRLVDVGTDVKAFRDDKSAITRLTFHDPEGNELEILPQ